MTQGDLVVLDDDQYKNYAKKSIKRVRDWWKNNNTTDKAVIGITAFLLASILFIIVTITLIPDITPLSLDTNNIQLTTNATEYTVTGVTEPNAKIYITAPDSNLVRIPVEVKSAGKFEYKLQIPLKVTDTKVFVIAKAPKKYEVSHEMTIQRPITPLYLKPASKLNYEEQNVVVEGKTDPQASVNIQTNLTMTNDTDLHSYAESAFNGQEVNQIKVTPDSNGNFRYVFEVPFNATFAYFSVYAQSLGKRANEQSQNIERDYNNIFYDTPIFKDVFKNNINMKHFSGDGFSLDYPTYWTVRPVNDAGTDAKLYLVYGDDLANVNAVNRVELIVWSGQFNKEFNSSLAQYERSYDTSTTTWWGGNLVVDQNISSGGVKGIRTVYKCDRTPVFSNDIQPPFYIDRETLTKDNVNAIELHFMVSGDYYESNYALIEKVVKSFKLT